VIGWLRKLFARPLRPRVDARTYDTREQFWGNSVQWTNYQAMRVHGWCEPRPTRGDILKAPMKSGRVGIFIFKDVEYCRDPQDMFFATVAPFEFEEAKS
jgi:hypothetical protein